MVPVQERQEPGLAVLLRGCVPSYGKKQGNKDYKQTLAAPAVPLWGVTEQLFGPRDASACSGMLPRLPPLKALMYGGWAASSSIL